MYTIKLRRGTAVQWAVKNPVLKSGEPGFETDTGKGKIGNGTTVWNALPYFLNELQIQAIIDELNAEGVPGPTGKSAYQVAVENGYVGDATSWLLSLKGAKGDPGVDGVDGTDGTNGSDGADGRSAYQVAVDNGYSGSEAAWLLSLKGPKGDDGVDGIDGTDGVDYTGPTILTQDTQPLLPAVGDVWIDTSA